MAATKPTTTNDVDPNKPSDTGTTGTVESSNGENGPPNPADDPETPYPTQAQLDAAKVAQAMPYQTRDAKAR